MTETEPPKQPEHVENALLGHTLTPEGWFDRRWREGKEVDVDPLPGDTTQPQELHRKFRDRHRQAFMTFMQAVDEVKSVNREMPILREELINKAGFNKQDLKDLVGFGLIEQHVIPVSHGKTSLGGRAVITPTLEGRRLKRAIEEAMAATTLEAAEGT